MTAATAPGSGRTGTFSQAALPDWAMQVVMGGAVALAFIGIAFTDVSPALLVIVLAAVSAATIGIWAGTVEGRRKATDRLATMTMTYAFLLAVAPLVSLAWTVVSKGNGRLDLDFINHTMRNVIGEGGGAMHAIWGTVIITGVATIIAVPVGILTAIYLHEYGGTGRLKKAITFFVDVMTGIPSIVAGLFAFALFALFFGPGVRLGVMGSIALSVLMIPIVVRSTEEMLRIVPNGLRESAFALGVPKWRVITKVVLPTALAGIVTGVMLAIARVIGETAPLLVTVGTIDSLNFNPFEGRMQSLAVFTYFEYKTPGVPPEPSFDRAWAAALTLIIIVLVLTGIAKLVQRRFGVLQAR
ncbi:MAG: phosphate ABC transporter permease PstA [Solirubrobacteraceae bacterium]|nr:phosphate ABC transporter permease PstA [Solirubrobacteraceae bacterium]